MKQTNHSVMNKEILTWLHLPANQPKHIVRLLAHISGWYSYSYFPEIVQMFNKSDLPHRFDTYEGLSKSS